MDTELTGTGFDAARLRRIADHFQRSYVDNGKIAGFEVAVGRRGNVAYHASVGLRDRERNVAVGDDTIWRLFSMTKPMTSICLMTLFEQGLFSLDDPVTRWYPSWAQQRVYVGGAGRSMHTEPAHRPVSVRDLLSHTSGLTYGGLLAGMPEHPIDDEYRARKIRSVGVAQSMDEFMERLAEVPLRFQPGTAYQYSLATDACGALVEKISGMPFTKYLQRTILEPLGMHDTFFQVPEDKAHRFAANYLRNPDKTTTLLDDPATSAVLRPPKFVSGGGGLLGTVADYTKFCEMLRRNGEYDGHRIVGPRTLELMRRNHLPGGKDLAALDVEFMEPRGSVGVGFGLGFASTIDQIATGTLARHDYYWGGAASTVFWIDPVEDLWVVWATQLMPSTTFDFRGQLRSLVYSAITD